MALALRLQTSLGLRADSDHYGNSDNRFGVGFSGGVGIYFEPPWGVTLNLSYQPGYPHAVLATVQAVANARLAYGALGLGWGRFQVPLVKPTDDGLALTGTLLYKLTRHVGLGLNLETVSNGQSPHLKNSSFLALQAALAWLE